MSLLTLTPESLSSLVGEPVPELMVIIAKNSVMDMDSETLRNLLGVTQEELEEVTKTELYQRVRLLVANEHARSLVETDATWDEIEKLALKNLLKRLPADKDPEFNLKVAAVANRAQRRIQSGQQKVLDARAVEARIPLKLTQRFVKKINNAGEITHEETREISVVDGTAVNPGFNEIDSILGVSPQAKPSPKVLGKLEEHEVDADIMSQAWNSFMKERDNGL